MGLSGGAKTKGKDFWDGVCTDRTEDVLKWINTLLLALGVL